MNTQQVAHWHMLAEAHKDTPGDLAEAYRDRGKLLGDLQALSNAVYALEEYEKSGGENEWDAYYEAMYQINKRIREKLS